jgi:hypothetical protein
MIQNTLQPHELKTLLRPFLRLADANSTVGTLSEVLGFPITKREDILCQTKVLLMYKEYRVDITDLRLLKDAGFAVHIQFKAKQKWTHGLFKDQNREIIQDLQSICESEIEGLSFETFKTTAAGDPLTGDGPLDLVFIHDSRAFNQNWSSGRDISPLLLAPDAHHGNCFVEFLFNPAGYMRREGRTVLRDDWLQSAFLISQGLERDARHILGTQ